MPPDPAPFPTAPLLVGLASTEAARRLERDGANVLASDGGRPLIAIILGVLREPMLLLLLGGSVIYLLLGSWREAIALMVLANFSVAVTIVQEARSERAIEALRDLSAPTATVLRDGQRCRLAARDLVRGDLIVLNEGDRVPADGWLVAGDTLEVDESLLTGEAVAVGKSAIPDPGDDPPALPRPGGEATPHVYSGTLVVRGEGLCRAAATGPRSEIGRIGGSLARIEVQAPALQRQTRRIVVIFAIFGMGASVAAAVLFALTRGGWLQGALAGIALAMALLPEEFPVVLAIFLAMGALRMTQVRVLARRAAAIETLGAATILCSDKTGTLTQNRMAVAELRLAEGAIVPIGEAAIVPEEARTLALLGALASAPDPVDPMETALHRCAGPTAAAGELVRRYPLTPALLAMAQAWRTPDAVRIAAKGAPEAIAALCRLDEPARSTVHDAVTAMAARGLRVLGVAEALLDRDGPLPDDQRDIAFTYRGLIGLHDPLRAGVRDAVVACRAAGIRVVMITGDHPATATAIARDAGLIGEDASVVTGAMLETLDDTALAARLEGEVVFARVLPEHKLRIVTALQRSGGVVGMTGDGVNDAPSLKAADIGIAMGGRGSDVAREAAAIVLLDDDFTAIVAAVRMGRRIYDNLRKAMGFVVAVHVPIAGLALLPLLFGTPLLLAPIHIGLLEMLIDPVCTLVFEAEAEERDVMARAPRPRDAPLLPRRLIGWSVFQGLLTLAAVLFVAWWRAGDVATMRTAAFLTLVLCLIALVLANRAFSASLVQAVTRPNLALRAILGALVVGIAAVEAVPPLAALLGFTSLAPADAAAAAAVALAMLLTVEASKRALGPALAR